MGKIVNKIKKICPNCHMEFDVRPCEVDKMECCCKKCSHEYHSTEIICLQCGESFRVPNSRKDDTKFCCKDCDELYKHNQSLETRVCKGCNKEFSIPKSSKHKFCSDDCYTKWRTEWNDKHGRQQYNCDYCGKEFSALKSRIQNNTTGIYCCHKCSTDAQVKGKILVCDNCGKSIFKPLSNIYEHNFCSNSCAWEYNHKQHSHNQECEYCHAIYSVKDSNTDARFCSIDCKSKWQSENLIGEDNPCYTREKMKCKCCGKDMTVKQYRLKTDQLNYFCSYACVHKFYQNPNNRTNKQKIADKNLARNAIKYTRPTLTSPHRKIDKLLEENSINYRNEELIHYYKMDIYLVDHNLGIEVNGDYWHCSPIRYKDIGYENQLKCIRKDKSKHTYTKNKYGYEILYLWEKDVNVNLDVCKKLIQEYIEKNGILDNYHSFNYFMDSDGELKLKDVITVPYQDMTKQELNKYINLKAGQLKTKVKSKAS